MTDLVEIGNARDKVLSLKLDQVSSFFFVWRKGKALTLSLVFAHMFGLALFS